MPTFASAVPGIVWPALPGPRESTLLAVQFQLQQTQWWSAERLREHQLAQLAPVLRHAWKTVPHYRACFKEAGFRPGRRLTSEQLAAIPLLTRSRLQQVGEDLRSRQPPPAHGRVNELTTSGSTGTPVRVLQSEINGAFWLVITLREHLWHRRDLGAKLSVIRWVSDRNRARPPDGQQQSSWGPATSLVRGGGPASLLTLAASHAEQVDWLVREDPTYLLTFPTNLHALARSFAETGRELPRLAQIRTVGETLTDETRQSCHEVFGVGVADIYSTQEVGYVALQCPDGGDYHVQSESVLVEVLDPSGRPCAPGEVGRVVVTALHNYASPLIRYDVGDYAEVGQPCSCGRGLPVLRRVLGRARNMLRRPDGTTYWPLIESKSCLRAAPYKQMQLVQVRPDAIDVRIVPTRPLTEAHRRALTAELHRTLGYPYQLEFRTVEHIGRSKGGKFEEFVSMLEPDDEL